MFYRIQLNDFVRVPPEQFNNPLDVAVTKELKKKFEGYISKDLGVVIDVAKIKDINEGVIIPGDGASYYNCVFDLLTYKPELQEIVIGKVKDIADFGVFMSLGPIEGMVHISQTMDDFVSFSKEKVLTGKETKRSLKVGDKCKARVIAVSYKDLSNPKLGLTMRQKGLGRTDWVEEDLGPKIAAEKK